jgi:hypothetical protein
MFAQPLLIGNPYDEGTNYTHRAYRRFAQLYAGARLHAVGAALLGRPTKLKALAETLQSAAVESRHYAGVRLVALDAIQGSESRSADFDASFRPLRRQMAPRWTSVASAWFAGVVFAPVELIKVGEEYFVRDGHHRISVARAAGQRFVDAEVIIWEVRRQRERPAEAVQS